MSLQHCHVDPRYGLISVRGQGAIHNFGEGHTNV